MNELRAIRAGSDQDESIGSGYDTFADKPIVAVNVSYPPSNGTLYRSRGV